MKVMITGAGAPGGPAAINGIRDAGHEVTSVDIDSAAVGRHFANNFEIISPAYSREFIGSLLNASLKHEVECIIPLVTNELIILSENLEIFLKNNIEVIVSDKYNLKIANDKLCCYQVLSSLSSEIPEFQAVKKIADLKKQAIELGYPHFPVVIKPSRSNGSRGVRVFDPGVDFYKEVFLNKPGSLRCNIDQYILNLEKVPNLPELMISEYLPGEEVTVDTICKNGSVKIFLLRRRNKIRSGISVAGQFFFDQNIYDNVVKFCAHLKLNGPIGLQFKKSVDGSYKLIEINPRVQGTSGAAHGLNLNFYDLVLRNHFNISGIDEYVNKKEVNFERFYKEVYF